MHEHNNIRCSNTCAIVALVVAVVVCTLTVINMAVFGCGKPGNPSCYGTQKYEYMKLVKMDTLTFVYDHMDTCCDNVWYFEKDNFTCNITKYHNPYHKVDDPFAGYHVGKKYLIFMNPDCNFDPVESDNVKSLWVLNLILIMFGAIILLNIASYSGLILFENREERNKDNERVRIALLAETTDYA